jgi:tetratricopeptide (TPR) repeat protein
MRLGSPLGRGISAALVAVALGPSTTRAAASDEGLSPDALRHLQRGAEYYKRGAYSQAEAEFDRVAHFARDWPAIDYNRGAAAEAQGKLNVAIERYSAFLPHADEHQRPALELRLDELQQRRDHGMKLWRQQRAIAWSVVGGGLALLGGGIGMIAASYRMEDGTGKTRLQYGGYILAASGAVVAGSLGITLVTRANRTKKAVRGLAFAPAGSREGFGGSMSFRF